MAAVLERCSALPSFYDTSQRVKIMRTYKSSSRYIVVVMKHPALLASAASHAGYADNKSDDSNLGEKRPIQRTRVEEKVPPAAFDRLFVTLEEREMDLRA
ncbi:uncharacterized protein N7459_002035 [Penicillium hispanicum]|uniref:uncharacterized protein n=1 Tax=Penicillium hispanicum TaxID=1080232 RepID=UPI00253F948E|nr:uncharacterized protein N7459_002035 [Penicillium hispanicum]KAJ5591666.1 hypothetical protein N7459_002035 [Penicillium hispanicum]